MTLGAGLVLSGCGDDDTATTPAPAPPPPPPPAPEPEPEPPPAPEAPATPTGFHVDTTQTSLTWHWNAVEGAIGYAVQVSTDEMFDDTDTITPTAETSFTVADLPPQTTLYARVAAAAGTLEAPLLSAWTTHVTGTTDMPPPPPPPPMAPATPTGLMAEEGDGSITWMWDAVEGADGYAVQVSMDEMFDDMDEMTYTMETMHTVSELGYSETRFARVASTSGEGEAMLMSMWTTHVTGMSMAEPPPPPPPAPDPVMVTFSLSDDAKSPHYLVADDDDDEATAMAWVNPEIMVESNTDAIITPMFVDGANGVNVSEGSNMPFTFVGAEDNWELSQADVIEDGATFMVQRAVVNANQEMEPSGDVAYVTCGPFACVDGEDKPVLSIADSGVCTSWDPTVEIQVGEVDNDVLAGDNNADQNDGVDLGIVTSSSIAMTVKHVFSGVANGRNTSVSTDAAKGSDKTLAMKAVKDVIVIDGTDDPFTDTVETDGTYRACEVKGANGAYDQGSLTDEPKGCFRLLGPGAGRADNDASKGADYLSGWSLEMSPKGADVTWGRVDWKENPFKDLKCAAADPIMVADHVDICDMFDAEVDLATGKGWKPTVVFDADNRAIMWKATASKGTGTSRFKTIWFDDNLDGKILKDTDNRTDSRGNKPNENPAKLNDLYNFAQRNSGENRNINAIWEFLTDDDGDLTADDLGKVDMVSSRDNYQTADDERTIGVEECASGIKWIKGTTSSNSGCGTAGTAATILTPSKRKLSPDGRADNYETPADNNPSSPSNRAVIAGADDFYKCSEDDGGDDDDGSICDAKWTRDAEVLFADGTFGCSTPRMVTITCTWDADGGMAVGRNALPDNFTAASNLANFLECTAK